MKKLLVIVLLIFGCAVNNVISQETTKQRFFRYQNEVRYYMDDMDLLITIHEDGFPHQIVLTGGQNLDFSVLPTGAQKAALRTLIKSSLDSITVRIDSIRVMIP